MQPVGDLCDLLGVSRFNPLVFDAMLESLYGEDEGEASGARDMRLARLEARMTRGR